MNLSEILDGLAFLGGAVFLWVVLVSRLYARLKERAPQVYAAIGEPHVIDNNTLSNNLAFLRFLLKRDFASVDDPEIRHLSVWLLVLFWIFLAYFMGWTIKAFWVLYSAA